MRFTIASVAVIYRPSDFSSSDAYSSTRSCAFGDTRRDTYAFVMLHGIHSHYQYLYIAQGVINIFTI